MTTSITFDRAAEIMGIRGNPAGPGLAGLGALRGSQTMTCRPSIIARAVCPRRRRTDPRGEFFVDQLVWYFCDDGSTELRFARREVCR